MASHDNENIRTGCSEKLRIGGFFPTMVVVFQNCHLTYHISNIGFLIPFLRLKGAEITSGKIAAVVVCEIAIADQDSAAVHILIKEGNIPGIHLLLARSLACPNLGVTNQVTYLKTALEGLRVMF